MARVRKPDRVRVLDRALRRAAAADRAVRQAVADRLGIGPTDLDALLLLDDAGPLTAGTLAEGLSITTGAVTGLVDRLERTGWVERRRHEVDRRQVVVELAAGRRPAIDAHRSEREHALLAATAERNDDAIAAAATLVEAAAAHLEAAVTAPSDGAATDGALVGALDHAVLRFTTGVARLALRGARLRDLYRAEFHGKRPVITVDPGGIVTIQYKGISWLGGRGARAELALTTAVAWSIEINRGVSHLTADLRDLDVRGIEITGGANQSTVRLPRPRGSVAMRVKGGANAIEVRRPRGVPVQAVVRGGANSLELDDQRIGAMGSTARLATPDWERATDRWSIELTGGASHLVVGEE
jgi:DNA-binding MarR family transcriptional regulator